MWGGGGRRKMKRHCMGGWADRWGALIKLQPLRFGVFTVVEPRASYLLAAGEAQDRGRENLAKKYNIPVYFGMG